MKPKHIVMVAYTEYATDARVRRIADTLSDREEWRIQVISLKKNATREKYTINKVEIIEVDTLKYRGNSLGRYLLSYGKFFLQAFWACSCQARKGGMDALHVHNMPDFLVFAGVFAKLRRKRIVLDIHDTVPETFGSKFNSTAGMFDRLLKWEEKLSIKFADRIVCVNAVQREQLERRGAPPQKITVLMNVPDPKIFDLSKAPGRPVQRTGEFSLVYHGTIAKRLGVDLILQALGNLKNKIPGICLHLWVKREEAQTQLGKPLRELELENLVILHDLIPTDQLPEKLVAMNLGVIGNRRDRATDLMLPVKMMEYMALKIPVVAPRNKAIAYYFGEDSVMFYEPENIESLTGAIWNLYCSEQLSKEKADNAFKELENIKWDRQKTKLFQIYEG
jgi:glycosyltransferase involved in cell wall biosynthesis